MAFLWECQILPFCCQCHTPCGLVKFVSDSGFRRGPGHSISGSASKAIGAVFQALLEAALRDAAAGAFEDEEEDEGTGMTSSPHLRSCCGNKTKTNSWMCVKQQIGGHVHAVSCPKIVCL